MPQTHQIWHVQKQKFQGKRPKAGCGVVTRGLVAGLSGNLVDFHCSEG